MFTPLGLFHGVACPEGSRCGILNCIFSHTDKSAPSNPATISTATSHLPTIETSVVVDEEPSRKRRRIEEPSDNGLLHAKRTEIRKETKSKFDNNEKTFNTNADGEASRKSAQNLTSTANRVSPPPTKRRAIFETGKERTATAQNAETKERKGAESCKALPRKQVRKEGLNPRHISKPPASHPVRMSILVKLHEAMVRLNNQIAQGKDNSRKPLVLSEDELIAMALDEEERTAKENPLVYSNVVKLRITKLRKMPLADWEKDVLGFLNLTPSASDTSKKAVQEITTGLKPNEEVIVLSKLVARPDKLEQAGYVTTAPTEEDIKAAKAGADASQGWEKCDRCSGRFQVFPGRRDDGLLASGGECTYHYARPIYPQRQKTDHMTGHKEAYYPCCNETMGTSSGCTKSQWHVFKVSETKRLASIMQFKSTPHQQDKVALPPVCFDCEMGYTTLGLELIRLTAITWPQGKSLLDVLVRPIGEILDFNTRYSGVKPEQFAKAIPYDTSHDGSEDSKAQSSQSQSPLRIVNSPYEARDLLFRHIQPETPLIGHALDNDLNACRIIHPTIVDTVLLYPHPRGLPMRFGLRTLTRKFLDRYIQTGGGDQGHDSLEDSRATGDLVRVKVKESWKGLKGTGWKIEGDKLVDSRLKQGTIPVGDRQTTKPGVGPGVLGPGAGTKRKGAELDCDVKK